VPVQDTGLSGPRSAPWAWPRLSGGAIADVLSRASLDVGFLINGCHVKVTNSLAVLLAAFLFALAFYPIFGLVPSYIGQIVPVSRLTRHSVSPMY
jgi:hypothetical protein